MSSLIRPSSFHAAYASHSTQLVSRWGSVAVAIANNINCGVIHDIHIGSGMDSQHIGEDGN